MPCCMYCRGCVFLGAVLLGLWNWGLPSAVGMSAEVNLAHLLLSFAGAWHPDTSVGNGQLCLRAGFGRDCCFKWSS